MTLEVSATGSGTIYGKAQKPIGIQSPENPQKTPDPVDITSFSVINRDTDAGRLFDDDDPKSKMKTKDYIAYILMLLDRLADLKEPGPGPTRAKIENQKELQSVLDRLD